MSQKIGIAWYRPDQWDKLREVSVDRDELEPTYEEWRQSAEATLITLSAQGLHPERVDIDIDELLSWCYNNHLPVDGSARSQFAAFKLRSARQSQDDDRGAG